MGFASYLLLLISSLVPLCSESIYCKIFSSLNCQNLFCGPDCGLSWSNHMSLWRMCPLLLLDDVHRCQLCSWLMVLWSSIISSLIFCLLICASYDRGVLKTTTLIMKSSVFFENISVFCYVFWCFAVRCIHIKDY